MALVGNRIHMQFGDLLRMSTMGIYGAATDAVLDVLGRKARMLGAESFAVHRLQAGFIRAAQGG